MNTRLLFAIERAAEIHAGQVRKGTATPYVSHLFAVATLLEGESDTTRIAALLHDSIEDQSLDPAVLEEEFGREVRTLVSMVSKDQSLPTWQARAEDYLERMDDASIEALKIIAADKVHNLLCTLRDRDAGEEVWERFRSGYEGQCWWYHSVLAKLEARLDHPLVLQLRGLVDKL
ncbi:HD domain-containing protein [Corynebacterium pelargi]|uniref:Bifunctional (P)ppGpp synthase/hydrolase relA n=1 Tax=Corynebacterium pelargi TaxID=1471400 RepID=A0A410W989_9CORY|nr:HD domain-containing protein [Corynebacterium pelargi]QAU52518.1 Bifunctional (p)ppGpp synthase/hydrolase relA [Corynebacterium pelargi]GGG76987.1 guanosine polyphosphate pyrophosphohydrolase [Corynebacterium pelargi]